MIDAFKKHFHELVQSPNTLLLAVSGGMDSVALAHLFKYINQPFAIAHCNFQLRGAESEADQVFVKNLAESLEIPFFTTNFDTSEFAQQQKLSIQIAARQLRYAWLEQIRQSEQFAYIATAHHLNDSIETALLNLAKGTGIRGLLGIPAKTETLLRPLLFATRQQIVAFVQEKNIAFREDSSNASDKYQRNKIRHHIVPHLLELNPAFEETMRETFSIMKDTYHIYKVGLETLKEKVCSVEGEKWNISTKALLESPARNALLFEVLSPLKFNGDQVLQIITACEQKKLGAQFFSETHRLVLAKDCCQIVPIKQQENSAFYIQKNDAKLIFDKYILKINIYNNYEINKLDKNTAYFDLNNLTFPLHIRRWKNGDAFQPQGMNGKRKTLKKFFNDLHFSILEKEAAWVLVSNDDIVWVLGQRIDERYKATPSSTQVLCLTMLEKD